MHEQLRIMRKRAEPAAEIASPQPSPFDWRTPPSDSPTSAETRLEPARPTTDLGGHDLSQFDLVPAPLLREDAGSGRPLPAAQREKFEQSLGADLDAVRIHTGRESAEAAIPWMRERSPLARTFTSARGSTDRTPGVVKACWHTS